MIFQLPSENYQERASETLFFLQKNKNGINQLTSPPNLQTL